MNRTFLTPILAFTILFPYADSADAARTCKARIALPMPDAGTCDVDSSNSKMGNPFAYINPLEACEFSFSLPGMPNFSLKGLSESMCSMIQGYGQEAIDEALGPLLDKIPTDIDLSMEDVMEDMFNKQQEMQEKYCPVYSDSGKLISYHCAGGGDVEELPEGPDWGAEITDPDDVLGGRECFIKDGILYCHDTEDETEVEVEPEAPSIPDYENPDLPICSELESLIDESGNFIQCRNDTYNDDYDKGTLPSDDWSNTKSGW